MADLVVAFGLGVFAASTPLARHLAWSALPILGAVSVLARSSCKRVAKTIVATTTSLEPSTPAVLPKIKRPAVPSPVHETIANVSKNQTANVSNFAENVSTIESPSVVFEQVKSNLNLPSTGLTQVVLKETLESNDIFEDTSQRTQREPVCRPTGIAEDLIHQTDDEEQEPPTADKPDAVSLDILVQRKNFGDASYEDILPQDQNDARTARPWSDQGDEAGDADDECPAS